MNSLFRCNHFVFKQSKNDKKVDLQIYKKHRNFDAFFNYQLSIINYQLSISTGFVFGILYVTSDAIFRRAGFQEILRKSE